MLTMKDIIFEGHPNLYKTSKEIKIPASKEDISLGLDLLKFCLVSQNKELNEQFNLRPAVGLSAVQVNILKRMFAIYIKMDDEIISLIIANPVILSKSKEMTYLNGGEGCLSVERETEGLTPRHKEITFEAWIYDFKIKKFLKKRMTFSGFPAIVFQHEYDHLEGILYVSKLYPTLEGIDPVFPEED